MRITFAVPLYIFSFAIQTTWPESFPARYIAGACMGAACVYGWLKGWTIERPTPLHPNRS